MSGETKFTSGPWSVNCSHIYAPDGEIIATVSNPGAKESDYPLIPNRNLIAASPDLYEALNELYWLANERFRMKHSGLYDMAQAALAKARGESQ